MFLLATIASAQQDSPAPTFHSGTRLVEVYVVARNKDGPARGLTKDDFTLLDNGKPQEISVFTVRARESSATASVPISVTTSKPFPAGVVSNRAAQDTDPLKSATALLIDRRNTTQNDQIFAIQRVVKFIGMRRMVDRMGLYTFGRDGFQTVQDLTEDAALLSRAADKVKPRDPGHICGGDLQGRAADECSSSEIRGRVLDTKHALEELARRWAKVPGRKTLIWVTSSVPMKTKDDDFTTDMEEAAHALNNANITLYAVDARGLIGALSGMTGIPNAESRGNPQAAQMSARKLAVGPSGIETMNLLAGRTGGDVYFNSNGIEDSIRTAVEDGGLTYTLGFYPAQEEDGLWHKLKVEVATRGVSMRYRQNYFAGRATDATNQRPILNQLLQDPVDATQLEVFAEAAPDQARRGFVQVKVSVDPHNLEWQHDNRLRTGGLDVSFFVVGSREWHTKTAKFEIPEEQFAAFLGKAIDTVESIDPAGMDALRVVVQDRTTGAAGSVTVPLGKR